MKTILLQLLLIYSLFTLLSCKKDAGPGGSSSIRGKIYARYYDKYFYTKADSGYAPDIDVYIIYGDEVTYGERQRSSYDGSYEFKFLRNGSYKIYAYSRDSSGVFENHVNQYAPDIAIIKKVEITKKKQTVELPNINILQ
jgi:hypothetical protein